MRDQIQEVKTSLPCSTSWPSLQKKVVQTIIDQTAYVAFPAQVISKHARAELAGKSQGKQRYVGIPPQSLNHVNQTTDTVASSVSRKTDTIEVAESTRIDCKSNAYTPETYGNDGFQVVSKKKKKAVIGTSRNSTILQAAKNRQSSVFLSRLSPVITSRTLQKLL